jgi:hypothetical protein
MDSFEKGLGGGTGGGHTGVHNDVKTVHGTFERTATCVGMLATGGKKQPSVVAIMAGGTEDATIKMWALNRVLIHTGSWGWQPVDGSQETPSGIIIHTDGEEQKEIFIVRGDLKDGANCQVVALTKDGNIMVNAGNSGTLVLSAGNKGLPPSRFRRAE